MNVGKDSVNSVILLKSKCSSMNGFLESVIMLQNSRVTNKLLFNKGPSVYSLDWSCRAEFQIFQCTVMFTFHFVLLFKVLYLSYLVDKYLNMKRITTKWTLIRLKRHGNITFIYSIFVHFTIIYINMRLNDLVTF